MILNPNFDLIKMFRKPYLNRRRVVFDITGLGDNMAGAIARLDTQARIFRGLQPRIVFCTSSTILIYVFISKRFSQHSTK